jgi:hypothetical protein
MYLHATSYMNDKALIALALSDNSETIETDELIVLTTNLCHVVPEMYSGQFVAVDINAYNGDMFEDLLKLEGVVTDLVCRVQPGHTAYPIYVLSQEALELINSANAS